MEKEELVQNINEMTKDELFENILGSTDVQELLCINRSRLNALVSFGRLKPIKILKKEQLFWKPDVDKVRCEMMKDSRTNLFKKNKGEK